MGAVTLQTVEGPIVVPAGGSATFHFVIPTGGGNPNAGPIGSTSLNADYLSVVPVDGSGVTGGYYTASLTDPANTQTVVLTHNATTTGLLILGLSASYGVGGTATCVINTANVTGNYTSLTFNPTLGIYFANNVSVPTPVPGCTNPAATNYNPLATVDNGSCILPALPVRGCTDPTAINYNGLAVASDGSCLYAVPVPTTTPPFVAACPCLWTATLLPIKAWAIVVPPVGTWIQKPC